MKITKYVHACLLVEMPKPVNRTAIFDPGVMSEPALDVDTLMYLDDIIITHEHGDHFSPSFVRKLVQKFPDVRITAPEPVVKLLSAEGIKAASQESDGIVFFESPHESVAPMFPQPEETGVHYLDKLTHPGDSHSFKETKEILALPVTGPWGANVRAVNLGLELKPKYILPIHDWHWSDAARQQSYERMKEVFAEHDITFMSLETGSPIVIED